MKNSKTIGVISGLAAFTSWGFLPAYWKQMQAVDAFEILCHRIVWSCFFLCIIISFQQRWGEIRAVTRDRKSLQGLILSGLLIGFNWLVYIVAVNTNRVTETSLGYYITPMVNVMLGCLLLSETLSRPQKIAVALAAAGVAYSLAAYGALPVYALMLAFSFAFYGYSRKKIQAAPIPGLFIETLFLFIPAVSYILHCRAVGNSQFLIDLRLTLWMIGAGIVTTLPLLWFAKAAKTLNLSTIGILQYLAPSIAFFLGVFIYNEPFTFNHMITFCFIWAGVVLYTSPLIMKK